MGFLNSNKIVTNTLHLKYNVGVMEEDIYC